MSARRHTHTRPLARRDERAREFWALSAEQRVALMRAGQLTLAQCAAWAARAAHEVPLLNGEFEYLAARTPEVVEGND